MTKDDSNFEISIFVPGDDTTQPSQGQGLSAPNFAVWHGRGHGERVNADKRQWEGTISRLMQVGDLISAKAEGWTVDEIDVGFTLSAKGELLFIAEATATASISVKLKRKKLRRINIHR